MTHSELDYFAVSLTLVKGFGTKSYLNLLKEYEFNLSRIYSATDDACKKVVENAKTKISYVSEIIKKTDLNFITINNESYPEFLKNIADPPPILYYVGNIENINFKKCFSIVGTRTVNSEGLRITRDFAESLSEHFHIVSGLALGVDAWAHQTSLQQGNKNVAVVASSANIPSPSLNSHIYKQILDKGGIIMSETFPGIKINRGMFVSRNRIVAGISSGTLVTQAGLKSGALITAQLAFDYDRNVYSVPGSIYVKNFEGNHYLISENKAKLVSNPRDIIKDYNLEKKDRKVSIKLTEEELLLYNLLSERSLNVEELDQIVKIGISNVLTNITNMELSGIVMKGLDGKYVLN